MAKIKVLRIIARLNIGGPARHVIWLQSRLAERFDQRLLSGRVESNEAEMTGMMRDEGVEPVYVEGLGRSIGPRDLPAFLRVLRTMMAFDPDVVDTHTAKAGMLGRMAALCLNLARPWRKIRTVHTFHGHVLHGYFSPSVSRLFLAIERFLGRFATSRIVVITDQQFDELARTYRVAPPDRFRVVPLGIDLEEFRPREVNPNRSAPFRVGLVGRLTAIKDPMLFLEAGRRVRREDARIQLVVVGDGEMRGEMEKAVGGAAGAVETAPRGVEFLGNRNDIAEVLSTLDLLVISSRNEGTPMSIIEAFAAGVPVVGTRAGGVVDLLADGRGLLSEIGDAAGLAANILRVARDPELAASMRERSLAYVREKYALPRMLDDMANLYEEVVHKPGT
jgi:glycosyltransferase involved in cell wall biosynthesis